MTCENWKAVRYRFSAGLGRGVLYRCRPTGQLSQKVKGILTLRIRDWSRIFETSESRKLKTLNWVAMPNKTSGSGYCALLDHPDGAAHYGAWCAIVMVCSLREQGKRGILPEADGTIGGISRSLGRISRLPHGLFEQVLPRLIDDPEIQWIERLPATSGKSPNESGEIRATSGKSSVYITGQDITGHNKTDITEIPMRDRFTEFIEPWPRVANPDHAARAWISCVDTPADEGLAFAARDRYLASDEVNRGVVTDPAKWLMDQKSAKWGGKWPAPNGNGTHSTRRSRTENIAEALKDL